MVTPAPPTGQSVPLPHCSFWEETFPNIQPEQQQPELSYSSDEQSVVIYLLFKKLCQTEMRAFVQMEFAPEELHTALYYKTPENNTVTHIHLTAEHDPSVCTINNA